MKKYHVIVLSEKLDEPIELKSLKDARKFDVSDTLFKLAKQFFANTDGANISLVFLPSSFTGRNVPRPFSVLHVDDKLTVEH